MTLQGTNDMQKILYNIKSTNASTDYLSLDKTDMDIVQITIMGITSYFNELSLSRDKDVKDFVKWYLTSDSRYHYNKKLRRQNSPQSYLAGTINNLHFGHQKDFSLTQLQTIQDIVNNCINIIEALSEIKGIDLQSNKLFTKFFIQENIWIAN